MNAVVALNLLLSFAASRLGHAPHMDDAAFEASLSALVAVCRRYREDHLRDCEPVGVHHTRH